MNKLFLAVMLISLLGCGSDNNPKEPTPPTPEPSAETKPNPPVSKPNTDVNNPTPDDKSSDDNTSIPENETSDETSTPPAAEPDPIPPVKDVTPEIHLKGEWDYVSTIYVTGCEVVTASGNIEFIEGEPDKFRIINRDGYIAAIKEDGSKCLRSIKDKSTFTEYEGIDNTYTKDEINTMLDLGLLTMDGVSSMTISSLTDSSLVVELSSSNGYHEIVTIKK